MDLTADTDLLACMWLETNSNRQVTMFESVLRANSQADPDPRPKGRFLSQEECAALIKRVKEMAVGGGRTVLMIESTWRGNIRWARNQVTTCGDVRDNDIGINRMIRGASSTVNTNQLDSVSLESAVRRAERLLKIGAESLEASTTFYMEPYTKPTLWFDRTYALHAEERAAIMRKLVEPAQRAGMLAAGYIEVSAHGRALVFEDGRSLYYPFTRAQYSVTVRDPKGTGSGWAGVDWNDWGRIDAEQLSAIALDKCLRSRNPVAVEPGRYTAILEPQAVCALIAPIFLRRSFDRYTAEDWRPRNRQPFSGAEDNWSKIGERVVDARITIGADPMDPELGFPPYDREGNVYHGVTWIKDGVLQELAYRRDPYGVQAMGRNSGLPNSEAFKMQGGLTTVEDMIATTKRGVLVTRFSHIEELDHESLLCTGVTRDGLWLVENGKVSKAVKNFRFTDSPLFALNNVLDIGPSQRVFHPDGPAFVPPLKVQDFSLTSLADAI